MKTIADLLRTEDIVFDLDVATKSQLFEEIGRHMEGRHGMPQAWVVLSLSRREEVGSTGLGEGVAIPHARIKDLARIQIAYFRLASPIPFAAPDGKAVSDILVLLVPKQATEEHLSILADATRMFSAARFRERLHLCAQSSCCTATVRHVATAILTRQAESLRSFYNDRPIFFRILKSICLVFVRYQTC